MLVIEIPVLLHPRIRRILFAGERCPPTRLGGGLVFEKSSRNEDETHDLLFQQLGKLPVRRLLGGSRITPYDRYTAPRDACHIDRGNRCRCHFWIFRRCKSSSASAFRGDEDLPVVIGEEFALRFFCFGHHLIFAEKPHSTWGSGSGKAYTIDRAPVPPSQLPSLIRDDRGERHAQRLRRRPLTCLPWNFQLKHF